MILPKDPWIAFKRSKYRTERSISVIRRAGKGLWCDGTGNHRPAGTD